MLSGFYTAASGMMTQQRTLNVLSNNFANVETPGFRGDRVVTSTFEQTLLLRQEKDNTDAVGKGSPMRVVDDVMTKFDPGFIVQTDRPFDLALAGDGFFNIQGDGQAMLTRNGNFDVDAEGYLELRGIGRVLGQNGNPIKVGSAYFAVAPDGKVTNAKGNTLGTLRISQPQNLNALQKIQNGMYLDNDEQNTVYNKDITVVQGAVERSNIDPNREMAMVLEAQRTFQSCSNALKIIDQLNQKTATELASL